MGEISDGARRVTPRLLASDPVLAEVADMLAYLDLHLGRYPVTQLTTRQKELYADLVDSSRVRAAAADPGDGPAWFTARWWRDDFVGPVSVDDPDWEAPNPFTAPDPAT